MSARITIERILRDDDDISGQSIRDWTIEIEGGHIVVRPRAGGGFVMLRAADVQLFVADVQWAAGVAAERLDPQQRRDGGAR